MRMTIKAARCAVAATCLLMSTLASAEQPDRDGAAAVLSAYKTAIERLDITDVEKLFSPDAIVISDINGIITSWNKGAEKIYLYTEDEALGKFLPMVPEFLAEEEKNNIKKI